MKKLLKHSDYEMDSNKKLITTALFIAIAVLGSTFSFPILGAKCAPVQHVINVLSAILLGPWYALIQAFLSSLIRNVLGMGTLFAFPGSMFGALLAGLFILASNKAAIFSFVIPFFISTAGGTLLSALIVAAIEKRLWK